MCVPPTDVEMSRKGRPTDHDVRERPPRSRSNLVVPSHYGVSCGWVSDCSSTDSVEGVPVLYIWNDSQSSPKLPPNSKLNISNG